MNKTNRQKRHTTVWSFAGRISIVAVVEGFAEESIGLWNNKCAIDRSMGLVSVSISINPAHLSINMKIINEMTSSNNSFPTKFDIRSCYQHKFT